MNVGGFLGAGANGIRTLTSMMKRMDKNGNNKLEKEELQEGFLTYGIEINDAPVGTAFLPWTLSRTFSHEPLEPAVGQSSSSLL